MKKVWLILHLKVFIFWCFRPVPGGLKGELMRKKKKKGDV